MPGAGDDVFAQRLERGPQRFGGQVAHHHHAEAAERQQHARQRDPRRRVGFRFGGVHAQRQATRGRQFDEEQRAQRLAVTLPANHQLLQRPAARGTDAAEQFARRRGADVMHDDEFGAQVFELLLQRRPGVARHEQFALVRPGAAADVVLFSGEVVVLVARDLGRERGLGSRGVPGVGCNCAGSCRSGTAPRGCPTVGDGHRSGPVAAWHFCVGREAPASRRPFGHAPVALPLSTRECNLPERPVVTNLVEVTLAAAPAQRATGLRQ